MGRGVDVSDRLLPRHAVLRHLICQSHELYSLNLTPVYELYGIVPLRCLLHELRFAYDQKAKKEVGLREISLNQTVRTAMRQSASARSMQKNRALLKQDPAAWAAHKEAEEARHRKRRKERNEQQKEHDRVTGACRSKKYYAKQKQEGKQLQTKQKTAAKILTRGEKSVRDYNREKQKFHRQNRSPQQKVWDRKKDREKKREKESLAATDCQPSSGYRTPASRSALARILVKMPKDPQKFSDIVSDFMQSKRLSPRKKKTLQSRMSQKRLNFARDAAWGALKENLETLKSQYDQQKQGKAQHYYGVSSGAAKVSDKENVGNRTGGQA